MAVSEDDVRRVAALARLGIDDDRVRGLARDLRTILEHMEVLRSIPTHGVPAFVHDAGGMPLRPDVASPAQLDPRPMTLAPASADGLFLVPRLASHESAEGGAP